jgi:hypothetical protein
MTIRRGYSHARVTRIWFEVIVLFILWLMLLVGAAIASVRHTLNPSILPSYLIILSLLVYLAESHVVQCIRAVPSPPSITCICLDDLAYHERSHGLHGHIRCPIPCMG